MFKSLITLLIIVFTIQCFAQPLNGSVVFAVNDSDKRIVFSLEDGEHIRKISAEDTVFYSINRDFSLKLACYYSNRHYPPPPWSTLSYGPKQEFNKPYYTFTDSTSIYWDFGFSYKLEIEIKNLFSNKKMIVICNNVHQRIFYLDIRFTEGIFEIKDTIFSNSTEIIKIY